MNIKEVALEIVDYKTDDIEYASTFFIKTFARYSGIIGTNEWVYGLYKLREIINNQKPESHILPAEGLEISFSGFPQPTAKIREDGLIFTAREPRFTFFDKIRESGLLPSSRNHIESMVSAINEEMTSTYRLRIDKDPLSLVFPKEEYARSITVFDATMITATH